MCHTSKGGKDYAVGLAFRLPFGTLYSTNTTPDKETGIGNYSDQEFLAAIHRSRRRDGTQLFPAMPYTSDAYMTDADALAIKAFLFNLPPLRAVASTNTLMFPFNKRWAMSFLVRDIQPEYSSRARYFGKPEWNRGAYLAEALAHCTNATLGETWHSRQITARSLAAQ